ncbi:zinc finger protein OZF-like [Topomyia yanbarensis]|uniref:zinc finger protein OZF-like n=1 Tax=Topomyia yanbarensis TaxID=2498891 RepID=UPI00273C8605|nr:zinc finger protein OZF-like [Topomyia yanbarensis]
MSSIVPLSDHCRCCLTEKSKDYSVFATLEEFESKICDLIANCSGVTITEKDDYPKFICGKCYCELVEATRFRNRCIQSQSILHEKQSSTVSSQIVSPISDEQSSYLQPQNDELDMETEWLVEIEDDQKDVLDLETEWVNEVKEEPIDFQLEFDPLAEEAQRNESNDPKVKSINIQPTARFNLARLLVPCLLCSKKFATRANLLTHMRFHPKKKCLMCDEAFISLAELARHQREKHPPEEAQDVNVVMASGSKNEILTYPCEVCGKVFTSKLQLSNHKPRHKSSIKCEICDKKFILESNYLSHLKQHERGEVDQCQSCGRLFHSRRKFTRHKCKRAFNKPNQCLVCFEVFADPLNLIRHRRQHDPERKSHKCEQCGKTFIEERNLAIHQRYHSDEDMPTCKICGKRFLHITRLRKHMPIHNEPDNTPGKCTLCDKEFLRQSELKRHMRWHSGELPHECTTCGKLYRERRDLLMHERKHTGDMPFKCDICDKTYASPDVFRQHKAFHNRPVKTHQCTICDITFSAANYLKFHMKKHINEEQKKIRNAEGTTDQLLSS